jgi:hypothetical protein
MIKGLQAAGKTPTRQGFVDGVRGLGQYDATGLTCAPIDVSLASFGKVTKTSCVWFVGVKDGKFKVLNGGKPYTGKLVGDPALIAQYENNAGGVATPTAAPTTAAP